LRPGNLGGRLGLILRARHGDELPRADRSSGGESPRQQSHRLSPLSSLLAAFARHAPAGSAAKMRLFTEKAAAEGKSRGAVEVPAISAILICGEYMSRRARPPFCAHSGSAA